MTDQADKAYQATRAPEGWIAAGHPAPASGGRVPGDHAIVNHMEFQQTGPGQMANLTQVAGNPGPLAESIVVHGARAGVRVIDQASAAGASFMGQFGERRPSGVPGQPPGHVAPTGVDSPGFRQSPQRPAGPASHYYQHERGELQGPPPGSAA